MISFAHAAQTVQRTIEAHPVTNWLLVLGSAAMTWIQPIVGLFTIAWVGLQIYLAIEKRWFRKDK